MKYPAAASTLATREHPNAIQIDFRPPAVSPRPAAAKGAKAAHAAAAGKSAPAPYQASATLSLAQWNELLARIGAIPAPKVSAKPTSAAIRDPQAAPNNRSLGLSKPAAGG